MAFLIFKHNIDYGSLIALHNLAYCYHFGIGCVQDYSAAFELYQQASEKELINSTHNLAVFYEKGWHVEKNLKKALDIYQKAANQNYAPSLHSVGVFSQNGFGMEADMELAFTSYLKAAEQGYVPSKCNLGLMYLRKENATEEDQKEGMKWLREAVQEGDTIACNALSKLNAKCSRNEAQKIEAKI